MPDHVLRKIEHHLDQRIASRILTWLEHAVIAIMCSTHVNSSAIPPSGGYIRDMAAEILGPHVVRPVVRLAELRHKLEQWDHV